MSTMNSNVETILRISLYCILTIAFIVIISQSVKKYSNPTVVKVSNEVFMKELAYPTVMYCPITFQSANFNKTIQESIQEMPNFSHRIPLVEMGIDVNKIPIFENGQALNGASNTGISKYLPQERCQNHFIYEYKVKVEPLILRQLVFLINIKDVAMNYVGVYPPTFFSNTYSEHLGSEYILIRKPTTPLGHDQVLMSSFKLEVTNSTRLHSLESNHCTNDEPKTLDECFRDYFQREMKCLLPGDDSKLELRPCDQLSDHKKYSELLIKIFDKADREDILKEIDCKIPCSLMEYRLVKSHEEVKPCPDNIGNCTDYAMLSLYYKSGRMMENAEALVYDGNDLIADIGGNLGLLLGVSIVTLLDICLALKARFSQRQS